MSPKAFLKAFVWYVRKSKKYCTFLFIDKFWYFFWDEEVEVVGKLENVYKYMINSFWFPVILIYQQINEKITLSVDMSAQAEVVKFYKDSLDFSELNESGIYHNSLAYHQSTQESKFHNPHIILIRNIKMYIKM